jgi:hypothetical protein
VVSPGFPVRFTGPSAATIWYTLDGSDPRLPGGGVSPSAISHQVGPGAGGSDAVVATGSRWRWFADATGLGSSDVVAGAAAWSVANWKHPAFDDARWSEGPSPLGYGEGDEATVIPFGTASAKWITSYYRHAFVATNLATVQSMTLRLKCDDGAIVYLNGVEVLRSSMPVGTVQATTLAGSATDDGQSFASFPLPSGVIREGTNVFAVELHQAAPTTSDASFDLELVFERPLTPGPAAFEVRDNLWVRARARSGSQWSAINEAFFQAAAQPVATGDLEIRELHLEPPGAEASEFVELQNVSARAVNLRGARFREGIRFAFPEDREVPLAPGQRCVLVSDLYRFRQRHGIDVPVLGIFAGGLNGQGESLVLVNATNAPLLTLKYGGSPEWPVADDGQGFSLVLVRPELGRNESSAWRASAVRKGSPGSEEGRVFSGDPWADADGDGLVALVEHAFGTSDTDPLQGRDVLRGGVDSGGGFVLTLTRRPGADDVILDVEESADLQSWLPVRRRTSRLGADGRVTETWAVSAAGRGHAFLRCRVERR